MQTIRDIYRIGYGPSSSHTMAPRRAAEQFWRRYPSASRFRVTLYGSLAATGKGHMTDAAISAALSPAPDGPRTRSRAILARSSALVAAVDSA